MKNKILTFHCWQIKTPGINKVNPVLRNSKTSQKIDLNPKKSRDLGLLDFRFLGFKSRDSGSRKNPNALAPLVLGAEISMRLEELSDENLEFAQSDIESFFHLPDNSPEKKIEEIRAKTNQFRFSGFISKTDENLSVGRASPDRQFFFINKRPVDVPFLAKILNSEWRKYSSKKYPVIGFG